MRIEIGYPKGFPRLYAAASLKREQLGHLVLRQPPFSAALCRGLIEAIRYRRRADAQRRCFPRLYAAASLKHCLEGRVMQIEIGFSAALCRGLIEATAAPRTTRSPSPVFRGFMPRPH